MKRRGQFYLVAVIVLIAVFFAFISVQNFIQKNRVAPIFDVEKEIQIERDFILDYIANNNLSFNDSQIISTNFSKTYIQKIGSNKNIIFISGNQDNVKLIGNYVNDTPMFYGTGSAEYNFTTTGNFEYDLTPIDNNLFINIYDNRYDFDFNSGQNIYYLIQHKYDNEVYIIYG